MFSTSITKVLDDFTSRPFNPFQVTNIDILRELGIDLLRRDRAVMPLLKNNPKVICTETGENAFQMQYRAKFDVQ